MKVFRCIIIFLLGFSLLACTLKCKAQQQPWKLAKSENGIEIFTRNTAGGDLKEFKAVMTVNHSLHDVSALITDVEKYVEWQDNCQQAELVKRIDERTVISRYTSETPWPFNDRDIVLKMEKQQNAEDRLVYLLQNAPDVYPKQKDYERIPRAGGRWELREVDEDQCEVIYQFFADPGGNVPNWLVKMFIVQGPYNSFVNMKELLAEE